MALNKQKGDMYSFVNFTWNAIKGKCLHDCNYCLSGETKILMGDFTSKPISDIRKGDVVMGLGTSDGYKKFVKSKVLALSKRKSKTIIINTNKGKLECTPEHKLYGSSNKRNCIDWRQAKIFSPYDLIRFLGVPKIESKTHKLGWMTGFIDGDGCFFKFYNKERREYLGFEAVCVDDKLRNSFIDCCKDFEIFLREGVKVSSKKSYNKGKSNPLIFSRAKINVQTMKNLYEKQIKEYFGKGFPDIKVDGSIDDFFEGYIGGILDTDGSVSRTNQVRISQSKKANPHIYKRIMRALELLNINYNEEKTGLLLKGGFPMRSKILFDCKPKHSIKSKNLIYNFSVKGTYRAEVENVKKGNMIDVYNIKTTTENYIANGFIVHNCYMKRWGELKPVRLDEKELKTNLGEGNFIFVGSSTDMLADDIPSEWIIKVLEHCKRYTRNTYLFQTKNPVMFHKYRNDFPSNSILGTTIETNRDTKEFSKAPTTLERSQWMADEGLSCMRKMVTMEPVMDFDVPIIAEWIKQIKPEFVNIGADSTRNNLPEPSIKKIGQLIEELKRFTKVNLKDNLKRIYPSSKV